MSNNLLTATFSSFRTSSFNSGLFCNKHPITSTNKMSLPQGLFKVDPGTGP